MTSKYTVLILFHASSLVLHFEFYGLDIVCVIVGRSIEQPGGSLRSVDRYPGSAMICLFAVVIHTTLDHGELGPVDH